MGVRSGGLLQKEHNCDPESDGCGDWWNFPENKNWLGVQCTGICICNQPYGGDERFADYLRFESGCRKGNIKGAYCEGGKWERVQRWTGGSTWLCRNGSVLESVPDGQQGSLDGVLGSVPDGQWFIDTTKSGGSDLGYCI